MGLGIGLRLRVLGVSGLSGLQFRGLRFGASVFGG